VWGRSQIIQRRENLVLYKSFNTLWRHTGRLRKRDNLPTEEGGVRGGGAKSYNGEKTWFSINRSILSAYIHPHSHHRDIRNIKETHRTSIQRYRNKYGNTVIQQSTIRFVLEKQDGLLVKMIVSQDWYGLKSGSGKYTI
jgi:hypothetical protein